jgi:hypothetical protein
VSGRKLISVYQFSLVGSETTPLDLNTTVSEDENSFHSLHVSTSASASASASAIIFVSIISRIAPRQHSVLHRCVTYLNVTTYFGLLVVISFYTNYGQCLYLICFIMVFTLNCDALYTSFVEI